MPSDRDIKFLLKAQSDSFEREFRKVNNQLNSFDSQAKKVAQSVTGMGKGFSLMSTSIGALAGAGTLAYLGREFVNIADTWTELDGRIKIVTESTAEFNAVQSRLFELAQDSRTAYGSTVDLYARLARATEDLGTENETLFTFVEAINKSLVVSGISAQEADGAIRQLSQGMASGTLRGEELNSVMENMPPVARAIAKELGIGIGQLREYASQGKITTDVVIKAVSSMRDEVSGEFEKMPKTVGQALTELNNAFGHFISNTNDATSATAILAESVSRVAGSFEGLRAVLNDDLTFFEYMTSNSEELAAKLDQISKAKLADIPGTEEYNQKLREQIALQIEILDRENLTAAARAKHQELLRSAIEDLDASTAKKKVGTGTSPVADNFFGPDLPSGFNRDAGIAWQNAQTLRNIFGDSGQWYGDQSDASEAFWEEEQKRIDALWEARIKRFDDEKKRLEGLQKEHNSAATAIDQFWAQSYRNMETAASDFFFDVMQGNFDNLLDGFLNMTQRMLAEWLATQAAMAAFGQNGSGGFLSTALSYATAFLGGSPAFNSAGSAITGNYGPVQYDSGGWINEPVFGFGKSGRTYTLAENGPELVSNPRRGQVGGESNINVTIVAADAKSFSDMAKRNPGAIVGPLMDAIRRGDSGVINTLRGV